MITAEIAKTFLEFLKLAPRYLIALGVMAAILLFPSRQFLEQIGVAEFAQNNRAVLGLTLVVTVSLFIVSVAADVIDLIKKWRRRRNLYRRITDRLHSLTEDEKQILRFYLAENTRANMLRIEDGVVQGLKADGIIFQSASLGNVLEGFAHNISDFAWDYLHVHPHLLEGTTNTYRTDKRESYW
ncbi:superinfection exclusion B family protein [Sideroxyarcus sp. TK5]